MNAGQNSLLRSCDQAGKSAQSAATQRADVRLSFPTGRGDDVLVGGEVVGDLSSTGAGDWMGPLAQAVSIPRIRMHVVGRHPLKGNIVMWLILLEALGALLILVFIVWWTMFSGRKKGERPSPTSDERDTP